MLFPVRASRQQWGFPIRIFCLFVCVWTHERWVEEIGPWVLPLFPFLTFWFWHRSVLKIWKLDLNLVLVKRSKRAINFFQLVVGIAAGWPKRLAICESAREERMQRKGPNHVRVWKSKDMADAFIQHLGNVDGFFWRCLGCSIRWSRVMRSAIQLCKRMHKIWRQQLVVPSTLKIVILMVRTGFEWYGVLADYYWPCWLIGLVECIKLHAPTQPKSLSWWGEMGNSLIFQHSPSRGGSLRPQMWNRSEQQLFHLIALTRIRTRDIWL